LKKYLPTKIRGKGIYKLHFHGPYVKGIICLPIIKKTPDKENDLILTKHI
jgi:hypothetical protein